MTDPLPDLLTIRDVAALCRVTPGTVWKWVREGRLPAVRMGGQGPYRIHRDALSAFLVVSP